MKTAERVKTVLILLLFLLALYLAYLNYDFNRTILPDEPGTAAKTLSGGGSLLPLCVAAGSADARQAVSRSATALVTAYGRLTPLLGEALGSASEARSVTRAQWREALSRSGFFLDYYGELPLGALSRILGASGARNAELYVSCLFLEVQGETVSLYLGRPFKNEFYRCSTAVSAAGTEAVLSPAGYAARFGFEIGKEYLSPDQIYTDEPLPAAVSPVVPDSARLTLSSFTDPLLAAFGLNRYTARSYRQDDGTQVYVGSGGSLSITPGFLVSYAGDQNSGIPVGDPAEGAGTADWVAASVSLLSEVSSLVYADSSFYVRSVTATAEGCEIVFGCSVGGGIAAPEGQFNHAAVTVKNGQITSLGMKLRGYAVAGTVSQGVTMLQAAAAFSQKNGYLVPVYAKGEGGLLAADWSLAGGER